MPSGPEHAAEEPTGHAVAVGIDVGGTKLLAAAVAADGTLLDRRRATTPRGDADGLVAALVAALAEFPSSLPVGIGVAGIVDGEGTLRYGPNLDLHDVPLGRLLGERAGRSVRIANDASVALVGEARVGAAAGARQAVMLTLGTGVGGAAMVSGELVEGASGFAGEFGHVIVAAGGRRCPCGNDGCLEAYASGTAIGRRAAERLADEPASESSLRSIAVPIDGKAVSEAALTGDTFARAILEEAGAWLGLGLVGIVNIFDPEVVVIGGGAATLAAPFVLPPAQARMAAGILGNAHRPLPHLVHATLGDDAGVIGAALLAAHEQEA